MHERIALRSAILKHLIPPQEVDPVTPSVAISTGVFKPREDSSSQDVVTTKGTKPKLSMKSVKEDIDDYLRDVFTPTAIYIYSDIITPRKVGYQENRLLRVVPVQTKTQKFIEFTHIEYIPLISHLINSISISIHDEQGERIPFSSSTSPIICTLHFRKIK